MSSRVVWHEEEGTRDYVDDEEGKSARAKKNHNISGEEENYPPKMLSCISSIYSLSSIQFILVVVSCVDPIFDGVLESWYFPLITMILLRFHEFLSGPQHRIQEGIKRFSIFRQGHFIYVRKR